MQPPKNGDIKELETFFLTLVPFIARVNLKLIEFDNAHVKMRLPISGNENHIGTQTAASLVTLAQYAGVPMAFATFGMDFLSNYSMVIKESYIRFRQPGTSDCDISCSLQNGE